MNLTSDPQGAGQPLYSSSATPNHGLGERMVMSDGRVFRYAKAGGSALIAGDWLQSPAQVGANHLTLVPSNTAIGASSISVTLGGTAVTANQYAGGWAIVSAGAGIGQQFKIASHPAAAGGAAVVLSLESGEEVRVALVTGTSKIDLVPNPYNGVIQYPAAATGGVAGVAVFPIAANEYGWIQRSGIAAAKNTGGAAVGLPLALPGGVVGAAVADPGTSAASLVGMTATTSVTLATNAVQVALE